MPASAKTQTGYGENAPRHSLAIFCFLLIALSWIAVGIELKHEYDTKIQGIHRENANLANALEEHVRRTFGGIDESLLVLRSEYERTGSLPPFSTQLFSTWHGKNLVSHVIVCDPKGDVVVTSMTAVPQLVVADREYFTFHRDASADRLYVGTPITDRELGNLAIPLSRRISRPDGSFGGVIVSLVFVDYFGNFYQQMELENEKIIAVVGLDGIIRIRINNGQISAGMDVGKGNLFQQIHQNTAGSLHLKYTTDGIERFVSYRVMPDYPLFVHVGTPVEQGLAVFWQQFYWYFGIVLCFSMVIAGGGVFLSRQIHHVFSERKTHEARIFRMAYHDLLTGLPNRASLKEALASEIEKARRQKSLCAILFVDLDDLKSVNDNFGHSVGDEAIVMAGGYIVAKVSDSATVYSLGGDDFAVLLPQQKEKQTSTEIAQNLVKYLSRYYYSEEESIYLTASIGIAFFPDDGCAPEEVLKNADLALHYAKRVGKSTWRTYEPWMGKESRENLVIKQSLLKAIDCKEFSLCYQPVVPIKPDGIKGFEALLRWNSEEFGPVPPSRFIPLAEESDIIRSIGKWVMEEACRFLHKLSDLGQHDVKVFVNVSPRQLVNDDFLGTICEAVDTEGIKPEQLGIEITENALMLSLADSSQKLLALKQMGIDVAIDDFGTGYSSLTYLCKLPIQKLKIDKSFIDEILSDETQAQLVQSIMQLAQLQGMRVVAEGVETQEQLHRLAQDGCDYIQGYAVSHPIAEEEAIHFFPARNGNL